VNGRSLFYGALMYGLSATVILAEQMPRNGGDSQESQNNSVRSVAFETSQSETSVTDPVLHALIADTRVAANVNTLTNRYGMNFESIKSERKGETTIYTLQFLLPSTPGGHAAYTSASFTVETKGDVTGNLTVGAVSKIGDDTTATMARWGHPVGAPKGRRPRWGHPVGPTVNETNDDTVASIARWGHPVGAPKGRRPRWGHPVGPTVSETSDDTVASIARWGHPVGAPKGRRPRWGHPVGPTVSETNDDTVATMARWGHPVGAPKGRRPRWGHPVGPTISETSDNSVAKPVVSVNAESTLVDPIVQDVRTDALDRYSKLYPPTPGGASPMVRTLAINGTTGNIGLVVEGTATARDRIEYTYGPDGKFISEKKF